MTVPSFGKGKAGYSMCRALPFFLDPASRRSFLLAVILALSGGGNYPAAAQAHSRLPEIPRLDSRDTAFRQYLSDVEAARRLLSPFRNRLPEKAAAESIAATLTVYTYTPREDDELLGIAARCSVPYGTLVSLNRLSHAEDMTAGRALLLPSVPGIFVPETPVTDLERLLYSSRAEDSEGSYEWVVLSIPREGKTERFLFIPGDDLTPTERVFFLNRGFHFPLRHFQVSSFYGPRVNPVTGKPGIHRGLDFAAPEGAEVYAVKDGTVIDLGEDAVLGKYIIIGHENNWVSFYGHLSAINAVLREELQSGSLIARVGSTGQSTGSHLHFELRQNGRTRDPGRLLGIFRGTTGR